MWSVFISPGLECGEEDGGRRTEDMPLEREMCESESERTARGRRMDERR